MVIILTKDDTKVKRNTYTYYFYSQIDSSFGKSIFVENVIKDLFRPKTAHRANEKEA